MDEEMLEKQRQRDIQSTAPSESRKTASANRYYHRGAYYMDEDEWDDADVRHKSAEYAKAATGEDKIDKSKLPKIMQRNKFGFARQNTKYKGLPSEDTSDSRLEVLPIIERKKQIRE